MTEKLDEESKIGESVAMPPDLCERLTAAVPALRRFALSLAKDRDEASDLVQETCLRALAFWRQWRPDSDFESWLFQITRNLWIDRIRSRQSRERTVEAVTHLGTGYVDGQRLMDQRLTLGSIRELLPRLPREQQEILLNVAVEGLSYKDASARLSTPIGTVMSRLSRARRALHSELGGPITSGLILALLLPSLDREAQAEVKDLSQLGGDLEGPLAKGVMIAPFLPLTGQDGRNTTLGVWITETLGKALSAITRDMDSGLRGVHRADVAASLFFLLLVDMALIDDADYQQLLALFERLQGGLDGESEDTRLALDVGNDSDAIENEADPATPDIQIAVNARHGGSLSQDSLLANPAREPVPEDLPRTEVALDFNQDRPAGREASVPELAERVTTVPMPNGGDAVDESGEDFGASPNLAALTRAAEAIGPFALKASALASAGLKTSADSRGSEAFANAIRELAASDKPVPQTPAAAESTLAFVLGPGVELGDDTQQDHWAQILGDLLSNNFDQEDTLFDEGEAAVPPFADRAVAEADQPSGSPVPLGELLDVPDDSFLAEVLEQGGETQTEMQIVVGPAQGGHIADLFESEPLDLQIGIDVQSDVS